MFEHKNKVWYKGIFLMCFLMLAIPTIFTIIFYVSMAKSRINQSLEVSKHTAILLGCICGLLFDGTCILTGLFKGTLAVVFNRMKEFFLDLKVSLKFAIKNYFYDLKQNGFLFWIILIIIGFTAYIGWTHYKLLFELI